MRRYLLSPRALWLHRKLGLVFGIYIALAATSGISHNIMSTFFTPPPAARPTAELTFSDDVITPAAAATIAAPEQPVNAVNIRVINDTLWYQILPAGAHAPAYVRAADGQPDPGADRRHAAEIAASAFPDYTVTESDYLTGFTHEYANIFRILPVYRFDVDDGNGTRVYVSTMTGSATLITNDMRQGISSFFSNVHKLNFIPNHTVKVSLLTFLAVGSFLTICFGLAMLIARRKR